jgi:lipopolysaccharide export system protein LptC
MINVALSLVLTVSLSSLVYWWFESRDKRVDLPPTPPTRGKAEVTAVDVGYDGRDKIGRPFNISADSASHAEGDGNHIALKNPLADISLFNGSYVALSARAGLLDRAADLVTLSGDVTLFHDNGLSFQTDTAMIDLTAMTAEGSDVIEGQMGAGELVAQGFRVRDNGDTIEFTGNAYVKIYPKGQGG